MTAQSPDTTEVELPKFYEFIPSILAYLSDGNSRTNKEIYSAVAERYPLSDEQLLPYLPNGKRPVYVDRISWGLTYLKMFGAVDSPRRGQQVISDEGLKLVEAHPEGIPDDVVAHIVRSARSRDGNGLQGFLRVLLGIIRLGTLTRAGGTNDMCDDIIRDALRWRLQ